MLRFLTTIEHGSPPKFAFAARTVHELWPKHALVTTDSDCVE
jgi:hypothetical protein